MTATRRLFLSGLIATPAICKIENLMRIPAKVGEFLDRDDLLIYGQKWEVFDTKTRLVVTLDEKAIYAGGARYMPYLKVKGGYEHRGGFIAPIIQPKGKLLT